MLFNLSKDLGISEEELHKKLLDIGISISLESSKILKEGKVVLSKNYPADNWIENKKKRHTYQLKPLGYDHLQVIGQKNGVIQLVPYIDAV